MRVLDHILTAPELSQGADHSLQVVDRKRLLPDIIRADVIVSHLAVSWRMMPMLTLLRHMHRRTPLVHVEHSYTGGFVAVNVRNTSRFALLLRSAYRLFDRVVSVSEGQGKWLVQSGAVQSDALRVIPSCVDLSAFRAIPPVTGPVKVVGAIGRLDRQKGFGTLIQAFRGLPFPDVALHIYGEGAEETTLRQLAQGDVRIRFRGFADDPVAAMAAVDAVAMPSVWEAYGLVAIEALTAGRPLLINRIDGMVDHLAQGARPVADMSPDAWETALTELLLTRPDSRRETRNPPARFEDAFAASWQVLLRGLSQT